MRTLAQRSAVAAKEIKTLIAASAEEVDHGSRLVSEAGVTMDEIVGHVQKVTDLLADISTVTSEQSSGLQQVGIAVSQMDTMTQRNAALVEQSSAAAASLKSQAERLIGSVGVFQVA